MTHTCNPKFSMGYDILNYIFNIILGSSTILLFMHKTDYLDSTVNSLKISKTAPCTFIIIPLSSLMQNCFNIYNSENKTEEFQLKPSAMNI